MCIRDSAWLMIAGEPKGVRRYELKDAAVEYACADGVAAGDALYQRLVEAFTIWHLLGRSQAHPDETGDGRRGVVAVVALFEERLDASRRTKLAGYDFECLHKRRFTVGAIAITEEKTAVSYTHLTLPTNREV